MFKTSSKMLVLTLVVAIVMLLGIAIESGPEKPERWVEARSLH